MLDQSLIEATIATVMATGAEFAEVFVEDKANSSAVYDDGRVEELSSGRSRGAGVRVVAGETTGFADTADLSAEGLRTAASAAAAAARGGGGGTLVVDLSRTSAPTPSPVSVLPESVAKATKVELLARADDAARSAAGAITQVMARYGDSRRRILVANSNGVFTDDDQVRTLFVVQAVASGDTGMQTGYESVGRTIGFELFDHVDVEAVGRTAADRALTKLQARPAPSGTMPVVIGKGGGGVLFHEACGHGLEADAIQKGASVFAGRMGEQVASELVTLIDDGGVAEEWGAFAVDDEGTPAQRNVLIEDGVLTDYMYDFLRCRKEGRALSGNGRRESYQHLPMVRMTNTYLANGDADPDDLIASTERAVYVKKLGGGQVNTATGDFVFGMQEAYLIEDGEVTEPLREGNLIGNGPDVLANIDALANDFEFGSPGTCGKDGQGVPVGDGTPTLRVTAMTIGGTAGLSDLQGVVDRIVGLARSDEQVEAVAVSSTSTDVRVYEGEIESFSAADTHGVGIRVIAGHRTGFAWAGSLDDDIVADTLAEARDNATFAEPDEHAGLAEPDGVEPVDSRALLRSDLVDVPTERRIELAVELERAIRAADPRISAVESCDYGDEIGTSAIASTTGVRATESASAAYVSAYTLASDGADTQTGFGFSVGRHPDDLDIGSAATDAVDRAVRMLGAVKPTSERVTVVLDPFVTAQFLAIIASTLGGESVMKRRSLFADRVGESVASDLITFVDDPTNPDAFTASAVDGEGLATRRNPFIDRGVLTGFAHNAYTGRALGGGSNGCAVRGGFKSRPGAGCAAVSLEPGSSTQQQLLADVGEGVLVQSVSGLHSGVNPISGDFSTGAEGLRISGGEAGEPLREFTIASTLLKMLHDVRAVGGDLEWLPMSAAGLSLVIDDVTVSGA